MASGSDDAKGIFVTNFFSDNQVMQRLFQVKLWNVNCKNSIGTLEAKVNVCCVHFNPESRHHLAFGSAGKNKVGNE